MYRNPLRQNSQAVFIVSLLCALGFAQSTAGQHLAPKPLIPLGTPAQNRVFINRLKTVSKVSLTPHEQARLKQTLSEVLTLYTTHDFDAFKRFMTSRKGVPEAQWVKGIRTVPIVRDREKQPAPARNLIARLHSWPAVSDWDTLHVWWVGRYAAGGVWKSADVTSAFLQVYERAEEPDEDEARMIAPRAFSNPSKSMMFQINHFFPSATTKAKYAAVYVVAQPQGSDPVFPRLIWLRWDKAVDNWILDRGAQPYTGERSAHCDLLF